MQKLKFEDVKQYIEENSKCKVIDTSYINSNTPIKLLCSCGNIFSATIGNFRNGSKQCKNCGHNIGAKKQSKTHEYFCEEVHKLVGNEFEVIENYETQNKKILFRHNLCKNEFRMTPNNFLNGQRCVKCSRNIKTHEEFKEEFKNLVGDEFELIEKFNNTSTPILTMHKNCNHIFYSYPNNIRKNEILLCPKCDKSKGEKRIEKWLIENNFNYLEQVKFFEKLSFDFLIIIENRKIAIEYQGEQHYKPVSYGSKDNIKINKKFKIQQKNDNIKRLFCKNNDILLIEIPFWSFDEIENILLKNIK